MIYRYLPLFALFALLLMPGYVDADEPPPMDAYIYGTVTVNGIPATGAGYTVSGGGDQSGLDGGGQYLLTIPGGGSGYISVSKNGTSLTVTNGQFSVGQGETIQINLQALDIPVTFNAAPKSIIEGGFAALSWSISNASYASINNGVGDIDPQSGSIEVSPFSTTTYTLTAGNSAGAVTRSVTVTVEIPESHSYYIPYLISGEHLGTGISLCNLSSENNADIDVTIYDSQGNLVEIISMTLSPNGQDSFLLGERLIDTEWVFVESDQPLSGLCFVADGQRGNLMFDISLIPDLSPLLCVPHVAQNQDWDTEIMICNPHNRVVTATLTFFGTGGNAIATSEVDIPAHGSGVYPVGMELGTGSGSVKIDTISTGTEGVAAFALYMNTKCQGGYAKAGISAVAIDPTK